MTHRETPTRIEGMGYRKVGIGSLGSAAAGLVGWYVRTKVPGWEDFPTEMFGTVVGGVLFFFVPERYR